MSKKPILKVQVSLFATDGRAHVLAYDKSRAVLLELPLNDAIKERMRGRPKAFFELVRCTGTELVLGTEVPDPGW